MTENSMKEFNTLNITKVSIKLYVIITGFGVHYIPENL